jgi:GGDEF domain-containing protein
MLDATPRPAEPDDRLTGLFNRQQLLGDLERALAPDAPPQVLVVFELVGIKPFMSAMAEEEVDSLLSRLALRLMHELGPDAESYRPRREEFCALLPLAEAETMLTRAQAGLAEAAKPYPISVFYGTALLPDEAGSPVEALERADERLFTLTRPPEQRRRRDR